METTIGSLKRGDFFVLDGVKYRVGGLMKNREGYVVCVDEKAKKVKKFHVATVVEKVDGNEMSVSEIRNKAIDEFAEKIEFGISESVIWDTLANANKNSSLSDTSDRIFDYVMETIKEIAEQMKEVQNETK